MQENRLHIHQFTSRTRAAGRSRSEARVLLEVTCFVEFVEIFSTLLTRLTYFFPEVKIIFLD